jgi:hypothetical protein
MRFMQLPPTFLFFTDLMALSGTARPLQFPTRDKTTHTRPYRSKAFVVQFHAETQIVQGHFKGRVEGGGIQVMLMSKR